MNVALIVLGHLFTFVAAIAGLLLGLSFTTVEHQRFPFLRKLEGKRVSLLFTTVLSLAVVLVVNITKDVPPAFETAQGPKGEAFQKATASGFDRELEDAAAELKAKAKRFFDAAEADFKPGSYEDAAKSYQKSIDLLPTMSAYLNAGISWYYISNYPKAEQAYLAGLQLARKKGDEAFEGNFLGGIGLVYQDQGKLEAALQSHQESLEIDRKIGNPLGEANALGNIGIVYCQQGKLEAALQSHQQSLEIDRKIGNSLGEAQTLGNIGIVYRNQGKLEAALQSYRESLEIDRKIGNPLGEAAALCNIGVVYEKQGKLDDALRSMQQAREIFKRIGARIQLQIAERNIKRITEQLQSSQKR
ncbi:tetratricopeptide repeat protein [Chlorobaculum sp. 24CR]|uniref:tetratricopeptide repeat protein n=1 Tax=Chlorobaculum sp. 24CR TaxID=2508878 RepID=UPI00100C16BF|nr:tetratricopeptide repeat protein [Chlorobaculum sp. 24CR]RXK88619.1 tetratricopeptide repeat protein [Chlorobaculum sp. 24CR]